MTTGPQVTLLDCTLRDGGYYNDWDFPLPLVQRYLTAMGRAGVDVVELGFRTPAGNQFRGPTAFTTDELIETLDVPANLSLAVMVNAKDLLAGEGTGVVADLFGPRSGSRVELVRIAAVHAEIPRLEPHVAALRSLGYEVAVNLMQVSSRSTAEIEEFGRTLATWGTSVAYVADSFGGLRPTDLPGVISPLVSGFGGPVGCHLHDNMTYALTSCLEAVDAGATWVDATLLGMGRGPGNVRTEYLALELARLGRSTVDVVPLVELVTGDFADMQREHGWGTHLYYFLSALYGVHPTYVMELTRDERYGPEEVVQALDSLRAEGGAQYRRDRLVNATSAPTTRYEGSYPVGGWCEGRDVLLVGPGPDLRRRRSDVEAYIRRHHPVVLAMNAHTAVDDDLVDGIAVCHPVRAAMDAAAIAKARCPVFAPEQLLASLGVSAERVHNVGLDVSPGRFATDATGVTVPRQLVAAYALALAAAGGARRILLAGFDGWAADDPRQIEMVEVFEQFASLDGAPPVRSLTRTRYPVEHSSLYAPVDTEPS